MMKELRDVTLILIAAKKLKIALRTIDGGGVEGLFLEVRHFLYRINEFLFA